MYIILPKSKNEILPYLQETCYKNVLVRLLFFAQLCNTIKHTSLDRGYGLMMKSTLLIREQLQYCSRIMYELIQCKPSLYITDDCCAKTAMTKKKDMLLELAFSGQHAEESVRVCTQKYNRVLKDLPEQTRG